MALRFGVDPYAVDHMWPAELRARALAWMTTEPARSKRAKRRGKFWGKG